MLKPHLSKIKSGFILLSIVLAFSSCSESSEWRDHNGPDSPSYFSKEESCKKIIGKLNMQSRLHKNLFTKDVFAGGMSSRWFEIREDSIIYFEPSGKVADKGKCDCEDGILTVDWEIGENLPEKATIYFSAADYVELRYYDYPFNFDTFRYIKTKPANNPTKIIGPLER